MSTFDEPVVAQRGSKEPDAPLVVLLHGRGSNEEDIIGLADHLPAGPAYAAVRAPIAEGGGYAWFANRGIGRPVPESLAETMAWFRAWLDGVAPAGRPVVLVGFSGGAAFAGGLVLGDPQRYTAAAILYGTVPFDAGVPTDQGRLAGLAVLVAHGDADVVIPRELLERTWGYLHGDGDHGARRYSRLSSWIAATRTRSGFVSIVCWSTRRSIRGRHGYSSAGFPRSGVSPGRPLGKVQEGAARKASLRLGRRLARGRVHRSSAELTRNDGCEVGT